MRHFRARDSTVIALSVMLLAACAAQPTSPADAGSGSEPEETILSLEVHPARAVVQLNDTIAFDAEMIVSDDLDSMPDLEWTSSGGTISPGGVFVAGRRAGKIDVTVKVKGRKKKARAEVIVVEEEPQPTSIRVSPNRATVHPGDTTRFEAAVLDDQGFQMNAAVSWSTTVGAIDSSGLYTSGSDAGSSQITATGPAGLSATAVVQVLDEERVPSTLEISPGTADLSSGDTQSFSVTVLDQHGEAMSLTPGWTALGGTITSGGFYTAGAVAGTFSVVASVPAVTDTAWVTVAAPPPPPDAQDPQPVGPTGSWSLIMADEFDDAALDPALWHTGQPWSNTLINGQQQLYDNCPYPWQTWMTVCAPTPHVVEQGGTLRLIATDDEISTSDWTYPFTSGAVNTIDLAWFTAPLAVEIRAKPPAGRGLWTELWLHPDLGTWPGGGEIDILELLGENPFVAHQTVHWGENGADVGSGEPVNNGTDWTSDFHTYTVEWTASDVTFWIDGVQTHRVVGHSPQGRMHLIMDLAVGGSWPVPPDASTPWPSTLEIEYVRVWER